MGVAASGKKGRDTGVDLVCRIVALGCRCAADLGDHYRGEGVCPFDGGWVGLFGIAIGSDRSLRAVCSYREAPPRGRTSASAPPSEVTVGGPRIADYGVKSSQAPPGQKSSFRLAFRPDSSRESINIGPPAGRRAHFEVFPSRIRQTCSPEARCPFREHYCVT